MKPAATPEAPPDAPQIGTRIRALRLDRRLSLADLAHRTGVSEATMSRIETGATDVSAPHLYSLARVLGADISSFFATSATVLRPGFRSLTRGGEGEHLSTERLDGRLLHADLLRKRMHPFHNRVTAQSLADVGGLSAHDGEEWLHVLSGTLLFCAEGYAPLRLSRGDSLYFDARHPHAYLAADDHGAEFLVVSTTDAPDDMMKDPDDGR